VERKRQEKTNTEDTEEEAQRTQRRVEEFKVEELKWNQEAECGNEPTADGLLPPCGQVRHNRDVRNR